MILSKQISVIVEQMPEYNQRLVLELVKSMLHPDDVLTDEDIADIKQARAEFARGEYTRHEDIDWD
ncbi:MAG: hypothetical protein LBV09_08000 [Deferribacteraceae bacterium]|jgi:hypothetical protein|nr:hypothetical protein [Deferribacteraceae bacterium]